MNKLFYILCAATLCFTVRAQTVTPTVFSSNGGSYSSQAGNVEWTIGEPVSETYKSGSNITTTGFHQPLLYVITAIEDKKNNSENVMVFPNPVKDELHLNFGGMRTGKYMINVTDALGKQVLFTDADIKDDSREVKIRMAGFAEGTYLLQISGKEINTTVKLNKVN